MKKSKFTEAQIVFAIKQFETGTRVDEISRQMGISQATFFNWKKKYGSMGVSIILPESWTRGLVKKSLNLTKRYDQTNPTQIHA